MLAPDVLWFAGDLPLDAPRAPRLSELVVEVRSPGTWVYDIGTKRELSVAATRLYWNLEQRPRPRAARVQIEPDDVERASTSCGCPPSGAARVRWPAGS